LPLASIFDAEKSLAYRLFEELGVTLTPAERAAVEQRPTANLTAFLAYSRGVRDEAFGQYAAAAANFRAAVTADPSFGAARTRLQSAETSQRTSSAAPAAPAAESKETKTAEAAKPDAPAPPAASPLASSNAVAMAGGAVNPSPVTTVTAGASAGSTQQQQSQQSTTPPAPPKVLTTVIINVKQLP
jgi:hypothetical protein